MAKTYKFTKKDKNRFRKIYRYIRRKPVLQYCSDSDFKLVVEKSISTHFWPVTFTFPTTVVYTNVPVVTAISYDSNNNNSANVNIFITSITTSAVQFESSAPFTGKVQFHIISQD